ncbi:hypothetical protein HZH68_006869 [Vespula germanica]|uniref:Uncharacterized protein n=1 Tax=Vespula germanica TaxID=30212 RepID=A0A834K5X2_VESGE|nr:hypothetical protein HZH68_006869 [Vespula germanica]
MCDSCPHEPQSVGATSAYSLFFASCPNHNYRTNSVTIYFYYYQESKATGRPPLPTNSSLQTLKLQPHASPHLGTDLRIAQLSNTGSFDHHLSTTGCAFATNAGTQN